MSYSKSKPMETAYDVTIDDDTKASSEDSFKEIMSGHYTNYDASDESMTYISNRTFSNSQNEFVFRKPPSTATLLSLIGTLSGIVVEIDPKANKVIVEFGRNDDIILREMKYDHLMKLSDSKVAPGHGIALYTHKLNEFSHISTFVYLGDLTTRPSIDELRKLDKRYKKYRERNNK